MLFAAAIATAAIGIAGSTPPMWPAGVSQLSLATASSDVVAPPLPEDDASAAVRQAKRWYVASEVSVRGLAGFGLNAGYHLSPRWAVDAGIGADFAGPRLGLRARWNILTSRLTPFLSLGGVYNLGVYGDAVISRESASGSGASIRGPTFQAQAGPGVQGCAGLSLLTHAGLMLQLSSGFMWLRPDSRLYPTTPGESVRFERRAGLYYDQSLAESGWIASLALGWAFR